MIRVLLRVKDKTVVDSLKRYGSIIYVSPVLNVIGMSIDEAMYGILEDDRNVLSLEPEEDGSFLFA